MAKNPPTVQESAFVKSLRSIPIDRSHEHAEVLLFTCIDFRFFELIAEAMCQANLRGKYDHFILAGAALGATLDFSNAHLTESQAPEGKCKPLLPRLHWQQVFIEHLQIALQLHGTIHRVMIIEHRDCGAYKAFLKPDGYPQPTAGRDPERDAHLKQATQLKQIIATHFPRLQVESWLAQLKPDQVVPLKRYAEVTFDALEIEQL